MRGGTLATEAKQSAAGGPQAPSREVLERNLRAALADSRERYKTLVEISSDFAWETDADGVFVFVSPRGALGYSAKSMIGRKANDLIDDPAGRDASPFEAQQPAERVEIWFRRADGARALLECSSQPLYGKGGVWCGARGLCRDVTRVHERDEALARSRNRERLFTHVLRVIWDERDHHKVLQAAVEASRRALSAETAWILRIDESGGGAVAAAAGAGAEINVARMLPGDLADAGAAVEIEADGMRLLAAQTRYRAGATAVLCAARPRDGLPWDADDRALIADIAAQIGIAITQVDNLAALERLSRMDGLTGLLVRRAFAEEAGQRLAAPGALVYIDLDNFKPVNDLLGHAAGDQALRAVGDLLRDAVGPEDLAARIGGDEFALWLADADGDAAFRRARALRQAAAEVLQPFSAVADRPLGFSIGIAVHEPASGDDLDAVIARADGVMYEVKRAGKGGIRVAGS